MCSHIHDLQHGQHYYPTASSNAHANDWGSGCPLGKIPSHVAVPMNQMAPQEE